MIAFTSPCALARACRVTLAGAVFVVALANVSHASTNSGIDTPQGVTSLPFAVEGVEGMRLVTQNPTAGPIYLGIGMTNPTQALDVNGTVMAESSSWWSGCFGSDCTGGSASPYGIYGNGTSYGVYGHGNGATTAVAGISDSGWGGYFTGQGGVYGQGGANNWAGEFYNTGGQYGVWIGNPWNNALLCLNGQCTTNLPPSPIYQCPTDYSAGPGGSWASFGCIGQLTRNPTCSNVACCPTRVVVTDNCSQIY